MRIDILVEGICIKSNFHSHLTGLSERFLTKRFLTQTQVDTHRRKTLHMYSMSKEIQSAFQPKQTQTYPYQGR